MEEFPAADTSANLERPETGKKRRRVFGEKGWLNDILRNRSDRTDQDSSTSLEEDDDEESQPTIFSKGKSIFRRLFKNHVSHEPLTEPLPIPEWRASAQPTATETGGLPRESTPEPYKTTRVESQNNPLSAEQMTEADSSPEPVAVAASEQQFSEQPTSLQSDTLPAEPSESIPEPTYSEEPTSEQQIAVQPIPIAESAVGDEPPERIVYDRTTYIERPSAAGPLIALEYFGRKRADRKIRKQVAKLDKKITASNTDQTQLKELVQQSRDQVTLLAERRSTPNTASNTAERPLRPVISREAIKMRSERPERLSTPQELPERRPDVHIPASLRTEPETPREIHYTNPERVLKEVVEAANKDAAIEKIYELRGEIKDEQSAPAHSGAGATAVGSILQQTQQVVAAEHQKLAKAAQQKYQKQATDDQTMYRQAALSGVITGTILLAVAYVVLLLR